MKIDWIPTNRNGVCSDMNISGIRIYVEVTSSGRFTIDRLYETSPHIRPRFARPVTIYKNDCLTLEEAKKTAENFILEMFHLNEEKKEEVVILKEEPETIEETVEVTETEVPVVEEVEVPSEEELKVFIDRSDNIITMYSNKEDATIKYTLTGKDVKSTNKIYKEPITLTDEVAIVKAKAFLGEITSNQVELNI